METSALFIVAVQEDTLNETRQIETDSAAYLDQISRYFSVRAKVCSKVAKYPHLVSPARCDIVVWRNEHTGTSLLRHMWRCLNFMLLFLTVICCLIGRLQTGCGGNWWETVCQLAVDGYRAEKPICEYSVCDCRFQMVNYSAVTRDVSWPVVHARSLTAAVSTSLWHVNHTWCIWVHNSWLTRVLSSVARLVWMIWWQRIWKRSRSLDQRTPTTSTDAPVFQRLSFWIDIAFQCWAIFCGVYIRRLLIRSWF